MGFRSVPDGFKDSQFNGVPSEFHVLHKHIHFLCGFCRAYATRAKDFKGFQGCSRWVHSITRVFLWYNGVPAVFQWISGSARRVKDVP